ncbi:MAG: sulfotransferase domain-containing protein [Verrucomicrobiales bacterium]
MRPTRFSLFHNAHNDVGQPDSRHDRVLIFGLAKSGTTALYTSICQALEKQNPTQCFEPQSKSAFAAALAQPGALVMKVLRRALIEIHDDTELCVEVNRSIPHQIFLVRDVRDVVVSGLVYRLWNSERWDDATVVEPWLEVLQRKQENPRSISFCDLFFQAKGWMASTMENPESPLVASLKHILHFEKLCQRVLRYRYEDFVMGKVGDLEHYLGFSVPTQPTVPDELKRVNRTRGSGSWRHWFTPEDLPWAKNTLGPILETLGYAVDWELEDQPVIAPEHAQDYVRRILVQKAELLGRSSKHSE